MKPGTRVEILNGQGVANEFGRVVRHHRDWKGREDEIIGWQTVRYDGMAPGMALMVHESGLRVIDNRAA